MASDLINKEERYCRLAGDIVSNGTTLHVHHEKEKKK